MVFCHRRSANFSTRLSCLSTPFDRKKICDCEKILKIVMSTLRIATRQLSSRSGVFQREVQCLRTRSFNSAPPQARQSSTAKLALIGTGVGAVGGSVYTFYNSWLDKNAHKEHEKHAPTIIKEFPKEVQITKRYVNPSDNSNLEIVLFQFQTCPFCCKVICLLFYLYNETGGCGRLWLSTKEVMHFI